MGKYITSKPKSKESWSGYSNSWKSKLQNKTKKIIRDKEGHFIIQEENITSLKMYVHNRASKYVKKKLIEQKKVDSVTRVGNHTTPFWTSRQKKSVRLLKT